MDCNFPFLIRRYSTFRNDLPSLVWQRYFTKASSPPVVTRSRSKCLMKSICVSQHCVLKVLLLMWSSPAALENVKLSASRLSNEPKSLLSHAAYHLRMISSFTKLCPSDTLALATAGRLTAPTSAHAPIASRFRRDTPILVILRSPYSCCRLNHCARLAMLLTEDTNRLVCDSVKQFLETPMRSTSLPVARRAQGPEPIHDISNPRFHHFGILSILCQRTIAFDHRDQ